MMYKLKKEKIYPRKRRLHYVCMGLVFLFIGYITQLSHPFKELENLKNLA